MGLGTSSETNKQSPNDDKLTNLPTNSLSNITENNNDINSNNSKLKSLYIPQLKNQIQQNIDSSYSYNNSPSIHIVGSPIGVFETSDEHLQAEGGFNTHRNVNTVLKWANGGKEVFISGTFNSWQQKIPMKASHGDFTAILSLPPGTYYYKYIVDGEWRTDDSKPVARDPDGNLNNLLEIQPEDEDFSLLTQPTNSSPPGSYTQEMVDPSTFKTSNKGPPILPPHLMRALLNTQPIDNDPSKLPLPHHVMLNHLYFLPRREDNVLILGITQRYREKFVTTVLYKATEVKDNLDPMNFD